MSCRGVKACCPCRSCNNNANMRKCFIYMKQVLTSVVSHRGTFAEEIADQDFTFTNSRRRSNSSNISHSARDFKNKFEVNDPEPVFEESIHGPQEEEEEHTDDLAKTDSSESGRSN